MIEPIRASVTVGRTPEDAFRVFTRDMGAWWPLQAFSMAEDTYEDRGVKAETVVFEEHEGGRVYEVMSDGTEGTWATILAWDPPRRLVLAWKPNLTDNPPTELEVTFVADGGEHARRPGAPRLGATGRHGRRGPRRLRRELERRAGALRERRRAGPEGGMSMFRDLHAELAHQRACDLADQACRVRRTAQRTTIRRPRIRSAR